MKESEIRRILKEKYQFQFADTDLIFNLVIDAVKLGQQMTDSGPVERISKLSGKFKAENVI